MINNEINFNPSIDNLLRFISAKICRLVVELLTIILGSQFVLTLILGVEFVRPLTWLFYYAIQHTRQHNPWPLEWRQVFCDFIIVIMIHVKKMQINPKL